MHERIAEPSASRKTKAHPRQVRDGDAGLGCQWRVPRNGRDAQPLVEITKRLIRYGFPSMGHLFLPANRLPTVTPARAVPCVPSAHLSESENPREENSRPPSRGRCQYIPRGKATNAQASTVLERISRHSTDVTCRLTAFWIRRVRCRGMITQVRHGISGEVGRELLPTNAFTSKKLAFSNGWLPFRADLLECDTRRYI